eukprot:CAMPEP_0194305396 /NCGR_PEP_ID=MMETSP0171-20130528/2845_1 /TAXON_ID=218684 /ORGANISM="Corethron pennatum, Strain L29A3" /LENGTH=67 /DNA_ID=CAMNT_0039056915 /DNA_START=33 /DNA_END=232 /DNA_ORIENTATION=+
MNLALLDPQRSRQIPDRIDSTFHFPPAGREREQRPRRRRQRFRHLTTLGTAVAAPGGGEGLPLSPRA